MIKPRQANKLSKVLNERTYSVNDGNVERVITARTPGEALSFSLGRGRFGLGASWVLKKQSDGSFIASNSSQRSMDRNKKFKIKESV